MLRNWDLLSIELTKHHVLYKVVSHHHFHFYHVQKLYNHKNCIKKLYKSCINYFGRIDLVPVRLSINFLLSLLLSYLKNAIDSSLPLSFEFSLCPEGIPVNLPVFEKLCCAKSRHQDMFWKQLFLKMLTECMAKQLSQICFQHSNSS